MRVRWQPVSGGTLDYMEFTCDCGRFARIGVGDNNWEETVNEDGKPIEAEKSAKASIERRLKGLGMTIRVEGSEGSRRGTGTLIERSARIGPPLCYGFKDRFNDATCERCDWRTSCTTHLSIGCPHTDGELKQIRERR